VFYVGESAVAGFVVGFRSDALPLTAKAVGFRAVFVWYWSLGYSQRQTFIYQRITTRTPDASGIARV